MPPNNTSCSRIEGRHPAGRAREQLFKAAGADAKKRVVRETQF